MERLPKGFSVKYIIEDDPDRLLIFKKELIGLNITFEEKDNTLTVDCFVTGDTDEKGISIVALDNPKECMCLFNTKEFTDIVRPLIERGYYIRGEHNKKVMISSLVCPY